MFFVSLKSIPTLVTLEEWEALSRIQCTAIGCKEGEELFLPSFSCKSNYLKSIILCINRLHPARSLVISMAGRRMMIFEFPSREESQ